MSMLEYGERVRAVNGRSVDPSKAAVVYWMVSSRRLTRNFALDRAVDWCVALRKPLVVLEPLRAGYTWASDRLHRFVMDGMLEHARRAGRAGFTYYPYVEPSPGAGKGLLAALAGQAAVVVTDDYPAFFHPRMLRSAGAKLRVLLEAVDSNGVLPMRAAGRTFTSAHHFRRYLHERLPEELGRRPRVRPFAGKRLPPPWRVPAAVRKRWPAADVAGLRDRATLAALPIDHEVAPVERRGGTGAGRRVLDRFVTERLARYGEWRNHPEADATSGLSPYLHFGHLAADEVVDAVLEWSEWSPVAVDPSARGRRSGWWGVSESAESFLDELITWRELGFNYCAHEARYAAYATLPAWARATLEEHADDPRPHRYAAATFEAAATHDPLWNAAQRQLVREGRIHGYLRMLWGKKILEWSRHPREALRIMIGLNDKYALDGRDPNSYCGITWVLGRFDRPWAPEREIFGRVRYMSSANAARKFPLAGYLDRYGEQEDGRAHAS